MGQEEIGIEYGVSRQRIQQIEKQIGFSRKAPTRFLVCLTCQKQFTFSYEVKKSGVVDKCSECNKIAVKKMRSERWSVSNDHCVECGTINNPHQAIGLCTRCYQAHTVKQQKIKYNTDDAFRERRRAYCRLYLKKRMSDPAIRAHIRATQKAYYEKNRAQINKRTSEYQRRKRASLKGNSIKK